MLLAALTVAAWVVIHLFAGRLRWLARLPRSSWLSFAGGVSVAYVFVHLLPELDEASEHVASAVRVSTWLLALGGVVVFYGLERRVRRFRGPQPAVPAQDLQHAPDGPFWLHMAAFALYNGVIAYLMHHRGQGSIIDELLFASALGFHFLVTDFGLRTDHTSAYDRIGRWVLAVALLAGFALGFAFEAGEVASRAMLAVVAGGVVLNVLKEELPEQRESRFVPFLAGAAIYAGVLTAAGG